MSTKHTPGPWKHNPEYDTITSQHPDWMHSMICKIATGEDAAQELANARLIASLPDLLAERDELRTALKDVSGLLCRLAASPDSRLTTNEVSQINARLDQTRAVLAKEREG